VNSDSLERIISSIVELAMKMDSFSAKLTEVTKKDPKGNTLTNEYTSIKVCPLPPPPPPPLLLLFSSLFRSHSSHHHRHLLSLLQEHLDRIKATTTKTNEITKESLEASYASTRARRQTLIGRKASVAPLPTGLEAGGSAPNAPTSPRAPPPPPTFKAAVARANPVTALLTQIQGGTQLKKVDKESDIGPGNVGYSSSSLLDYLLLPFTWFLPSHSSSLEKLAKVSESSQILARHTSSSIGTKKGRYRRRR
jgi:hypothetical protein